MTGAELRCWRLELGLSQQRLADLGSADQGNLSRTERDLPRGLGDAALASLIAALKAEQFRLEDEARRIEAERIARAVGTQVLSSKLEEVSTCA